MPKTRSQTRAEESQLFTSDVLCLKTADTTSLSEVSIRSANPVLMERQAQHQQYNQLNSRNKQKRNTRKSTFRASNYIDPVLLQKCRKIIVRLRVFEMKEILSVLKQKVYGLKSELRLRILTLLPTKLNIIAARLSEICNKSGIEAQHRDSSQSGPKGKSSTSQRRVSAGDMVGTSGMVSKINMRSPIYPSVCLKKLTFYDVMEPLINPTPLAVSHTPRKQKAQYNFTLTRQQVAKIATYRNVQVQLRFCKLETDCEQMDFFPPRLRVKVNSKLYKLPTENPQPINITSYLKLSTTTSNTISTQWRHDPDRNYCIALYMVNKLTSVQLLQRLKEKGIMLPDYTKAIIKKKFAAAPDCMVPTMLKVSLNCPLSRMKLTTPCRALTCKHVQCFDAGFYLKTNEQKPTWNCPVCNETLAFDNLVIDGYFQDILDSIEVYPDRMEIKLHKDGSWSALKFVSDIRLDSPVQSYANMDELMATAGIYKQLSPPYSPGTIA